MYKEFIIDMEKIILVTLKTHNIKILTRSLRMTKIAKWQIF